MKEKKKKTAETSLAEKSFLLETIKRERERKRERESERCLIDLDWLEFNYRIIESNF